MEAIHSFVTAVNVYQSTRYVVASDNIVLLLCVSVALVHQYLLKYDTTVNLKYACITYTEFYKTRNFQVPDLQ